MILLTKGTRIVKINSQPGDTHEDGSPGVITRVIPIPKEFKEIDGIIKSLSISWPSDYKDLGSAEGMYVVEWDDYPGIPIHITSNRVKEDKS